MQDVITAQNVYTKRTFTVCASHELDHALLGDVQVQHGEHEGACDFCDPIGDTCTNE